MLLFRIMCRDFEHFIQTNESHLMYKHIKLKIIKMNFVFVIFVVFVMRRILRSIFNENRF